MDLFVPKSWDDLQLPDCVEKRKKAHIPDGVHYRQKWQIALEQIDLALKDGIPHQVIVADSWYGNIPEFRKALDERKEHYVVGICSDTEVFIEKPIAKVLEKTKRKRGKPKKTSELFSATSEPITIKVSDMSNLPDAKLPIDILRLYHERFWIEQGYQQLKEELGIDHHEGRSWIGWHRHVLLTSLAFGYLLTLRFLEKKLIKPGK
jgi:SRSO17 transposase